MQIVTLVQIDLCHVFRETTFYNAITEHVCVCVMSGMDPGECGVTGITTPLTKGLNHNDKKCIIHIYNI